MKTLSWLYLLFTLISCKTSGSQTQELGGSFAFDGVEHSGVIWHEKESDKYYMRLCGKGEFPAHDCPKGETLPWHYEKGIEKAVRRGYAPALGIEPENVDYQLVKDVLDAIKSGDLTYSNRGTKFLLAASAFLGEGLLKEMERPRDKCLLDCTENDICTKCSATVDGHQLPAFQCKHSHDARHLAFQSCLNSKKDIPCNISCTSIGNVTEKPQALLSTVAQPKSQPKRSKKIEGYSDVVNAARKACNACNQLLDSNCIECKTYDKSSSTFSKNTTTCSSIQDSEIQGWLEENRSRYESTFYPAYQVASEESCDDKTACRVVCSKAPVKTYGGGGGYRGSL